MEVAVVLDAARCCLGQSSKRAKGEKGLTLPPSVAALVIGQPGGDVLALQASWAAIGKQPWPGLNALCILFIFKKRYL